MSRTLALTSLAFLAPTLALASAPAPSDSAVQLDRISVTARLPEDPRRRAEAVAVLDAATLARINGAHANEVLVRVPGAWASRGSGQEQLLALRSPVLTGPGACGAFLLLDDGVPTRPAGFCNVNQLSEVNLAQAGRVEVLRGPGSAVHGSNALHGVLSVLPRLPGEGGGLRLDIGTDDYRRALLALDGARARVDAQWVDAGSFRADEGYTLGQSTWQWLAGDATRVALSTHRLRQDTAGFVFGEGAWRDARRFDNLNPEAFRSADAQRLVVTHERDLGGTTLLLRPYARHEQQTFLQHFLLGKPLEDTGSRSLGVQALLRRGELRFGLDVEAVDGRLRQRQALPLTTGSAAQNAIRPAGRHYDYGVTARQLAVFGERQWLLGGGTLTAGARLERLNYRYDNRMADGNAAESGQPCAFGGCLYLRPADRSDGFTGRSAQLGYLKPLDGGWSVGARAARAFRFPQATELYRLQRGQSIDGIRPETADSLDAVVRRDGEASRIGLVLYAMAKRDVILRDANGLSVTGAATRHRGAELAWRWQPSDARWLDANLAYSDQRYDFDRRLAGNETIRRGAVVDTAPRWLGGLRAGQRFAGRWEAELEGVWQGGYFIDAGNTRRYGGHVLWNLRIDHELAARWTLGLRVMNLADRRYAERVDFAFGDVRSFPGAGRGVFVSLGFRP